MGKIRLKKCVKCGAKKDPSEFGTNNDTHDGRQTYCNECKNALGVRRREKNVSARLRHHIATRITDQLGNHCPKDITRRLDYYLGYKVSTLVKALREDLKQREGEDRSLRAALNEGYHVDHLRPLRLYKVVVNGQVDWDEFQRCWDPKNLSAIPAQENLSKGGKWDGD